MRKSATDRIIVRCRCGHKFGVPLSAAGKKNICPRCQRVFLLPASVAHAKRSATDVRPARSRAADMKRMPSKPTRPPVRPEDEPPLEFIIEDDDPGYEMVES